MAGGSEAETMSVRDWRGRKERTGNGTENESTTARAIWQVDACLTRANAAQGSKPLKLEIPTMRLRVDACQFAPEKDNKYTPETSNL